LKLNELSARKHRADKTNDSDMNWNQVSSAQPRLRSVGCEANLGISIAATHFSVRGVVRKDTIRSKAKFEGACCESILGADLSGTVREHRAWQGASFFWPSRDPGIFEHVPDWPQQQQPVARPMFAPQAPKSHASAGAALAETAIASSEKMTTRTKDML
jgi:hypothetical protein